MTVPIPDIMAVPLASFGPTSIARLHGLGPITYEVIWDQHRWLRSDYSAAWVLYGELSMRHLMDVVERLGRPE